MRTKHLRVAALLMAVSAAPAQAGAVREECANPVFKQYWFKGCEAPERYVVEEGAVDPRYPESAGGYTP